MVLSPSCGAPWLTSWSTCRPTPCHCEIAAFSRCFVSSERLLRASSVAEMPPNEAMQKPISPGLRPCRNARNAAMAASAPTVVSAALTSPGACHNGREEPKVIR